MRKNRRGGPRRRREKRIDADAGRSRHKLSRRRRARAVSWAGTGRRRDAVRHRPRELEARDGRRADRAGPRRKRRKTAAKRLAEVAGGAIFFGAQPPRKRVGLGGPRRETDKELSDQTAADARFGDAPRERRDGEERRRQKQQRRAEPGARARRRGESGRRRRHRFRSRRSKAAKISRGVRGR